jgi:hypothetical protein
MWFFGSKGHLGRFFPRASISPAKHLTDGSTLIIIIHQLGLVKEAKMTEVPSGLSLTPYQDIQDSLTFRI